MTEQRFASVSGKIIDFMQKAEQMSREDLLALRIIIESEMDSIEEQLSRAGALAKRTGVYADSDWYWSAKRALQNKRRQVQVIQKELGLRRRKQARPTLAQYFMDVARHKLDPEIFANLCEEAQLIADWDLRHYEKSGDKNGLGIGATDA